jgi:hypothetical protein
MTWKVVTEVKISMTLFWNTTTCKNLGKYQIFEANAVSFFKPLYFDNFRIERLYYYFNKRTKGTTKHLSSSCLRICFFLSLKGFYSCKSHATLSLYKFLVSHLYIGCVRSIADKNVPRHDCNNPNRFKTNQQTLKKLKKIDLVFRSSAKVFLYFPVSSEIGKE